MSYWQIAMGTPRKAKEIAKEWQRLYGEKDVDDLVVLCALALAAVAWVVAVIFALSSLILGS